MLKETGFQIKVTPAKSQIWGFQMSGMTGHLKGEIVS